MFEIISFTGCEVSGHTDSHYSLTLERADTEENGLRGVSIRDRGVWSSVVRNGQASLERANFLCLDPFVSVSVLRDSCNR